MSTTVEKQIFKLNPEKARKVVNISATFTGTREETLKELFKDILIEIPEGENVKFAVISASTSRDLFQIITTLEEPIATDENIRIRIDASKLKGILNNFEESVKIEASEKDIKFTSKKSSIKIHKIPPSMLKEQFDIIKLEKDKQLITSIEANNFLSLLYQISQIPMSEKTGHPVKISFDKEKIFVETAQSEGHYAALGEIDHPSNVEEPQTFLIPANIVPKLILILKTIKDKAIDVYTNKSKTKLQIKSKILNYTFYLEETEMPDIYSMKENLDQMSFKEIIIDPMELEKAMELVNFVNGESTIIKITAQNNKVLVKSLDGEEVNKEIDAITDETVEMTAIVKVVQKSLKTYTNHEISQNSKVKIKIIEEKLICQLEHPEKTFPCVIFAGAQK